MSEMMDVLRFDAAPLRVSPATSPAAGAPGGETDGTNWVHRPARLFVAGDYPDKNVIVTQADLDALIARFYASGARCPVQLEHISTALDPLGYVVGLYRCGPELYGMLVFTTGVDEHLQKRGVAQVSVGLTFARDAEHTAFALKEVSLVLAGRVPTALFLNRGFLTALSPPDASPDSYTETEAGNGPPARFPVPATAAPAGVAFSRDTFLSPEAAPAIERTAPLVRAPSVGQRNAHVARLAARWGVTEAGLRARL